MESKFGRKLEIIIFSLVFSFIAFNIIGSFNKYNKVKAQTIFVDDFAFPNDVVVDGPGFFPFSDTQGVFDAFDGAGCDNLDLLFDGDPSLSGQGFEVGPAQDGFETGSRDVFTFDADGNIIVPLISYPRMGIDPSMGNAGGISIVPGMGFSMGTFMVMTTINCGTSTSTTSSTTSSSGGETTSSSSGGSSTPSSSGATTSSSGSIFTGLSDIEIFTEIIGLERTARNVDLRPFGNMFSVDNAVMNINTSLEGLTLLDASLASSTIRLAMGRITVQEKLMSIRDLDNEALSQLDGITEFNSSTSVAINMARRSLKEARRCKERIKKKLDRASMSGMSGMSGMSSMSSMSSMSMSR